MAPSAIAHYEADNNYHFLTNNPVKNLSPAFATNHGVLRQPSAQQLIGQALKQRVEAIDPETCDAGEEDAFFVADLGEVYRQHLRWKLNLGRVKPHYGRSRYPWPVGQVGPADTFS
jgi:ornithine decarboxylase